VGDDLAEGCAVTRYRRGHTTTSARCYSISFSAGFLGLGRPTALAVLTSCLQLFEVLRAPLGDLPPTFPSKRDGSGIFLLWQSLEVLAPTPDRIMHDMQSSTNENAVAISLVSLFHNTAVERSPQWSSVQIHSGAASSSLRFGKRCIFSITGVQNADSSSCQQNLFD
jgi:hypothetical protein